MPAWSFACIDLIAVHSEIYWRVCIEELTVKVTNVLMCGSKNLQMKLFSRHGMYSKWANVQASRSARLFFSQVRLSAMFGISSNSNSDGNRQGVLGRVGGRCPTFMLMDLHIK